MLASFGVGTIVNSRLRDRRVAKEKAEKDELQKSRDRVAWEDDIDATVYGRPAGPRTPKRTGVIETLEAVNKNQGEILASLQDLNARVTSLEGRAR